MSRVAGIEETKLPNGSTLSFGLCASPDGRTVLLARVDASFNDLMLVENFR